MTAQQRINRVIVRLPSLSAKQLSRFSLECLLRDCDIGTQAAADEMSRRLDVGLARLCPHCCSKNVQESGPGEAFCEACEEYFETGNMDCGRQST